MVFFLRARLRRLGPGDRAAERTPHAPLVSCIMPTSNRRPFVAQAIRYFQRQDYPHKELIVVDDGDDRVGDLVAPHPNTRYIGLTTRTPIGDKRNIAIAESSGDFIVHWDDDDWHSENRMSYQIAHLISDAADMTALRMSFMYDLSNNLVWYVDKAVHDTMFFLGIHTGTVAYRKHLGRAAAPFPPIDLGEDVAFIRSAVGRGARLLRLPNDALFAALVARCGSIDADGELPFLEAIARRCGGVLHPPRRPVCVYVRHAANTWRFVCGEHLDPHAWHKLAPSDLLPVGDLAHYRTIATAATTYLPGVQAKLPEESPLTQAQRGA